MHVCSPLGTLILLNADKKKNNTTHCLYLVAGAELLAIERTEIHCFFLAYAFIWGGRVVPNGNYEEALKPWVSASCFLSSPHSSSSC